MTVGRCSAQRGREVRRTLLVLIRFLLRGGAHRHDCHFISHTLEVPDRLPRDEETAEHDRARRRRGDDALRSRARSLYDATSREVEALDRGRRVADIEAGDRAAADLAGEEERRIVALEGKRLLVIGDKHDLARAGRDAERRGGEGSEDIDDDGMARRSARTIEETRDADVHRPITACARRAPSRHQGGTSPNRCPAHVGT